VHLLTFIKIQSTANRVDDSRVDDSLVRISRSLRQTPFAGRPRYYDHSFFGSATLSKLTVFELYWFFL